MLVTIIATNIGTRIAPEFVTLLPMDTLYEDREEKDRAEHRHRHAHPRDVGKGEDAALPQAQRQHRFRRPRLDPHERGEKDRGR
jgi:hypothetical protein